MYSFAVIILINFIEKTSVSSIHFNFCFHAKFTFVSFASHIVFSIISTRQSKRAQIQNTRYRTWHYWTSTLLKLYSISPLIFQKIYFQLNINFQSLYCLSMIVAVNKIAYNSLTFGYQNWSLFAEYVKLNKFLLISALHICTMQWIYCSRKSKNWKCQFMTPTLLYAKYQRRWCHILSFNTPTSNRTRSI